MNGELDNCFFLTKGLVAASITAYIRFLVFRLIGHN
jgi:hypothetical protein